MQKNNFEKKKYYFLIILLIPIIIFTILDNIEYNNWYNSEEKIVEEIYVEILHRTADKESLEHYSSLLSSGNITETGLRDILLESEERQNLLVYNLLVETYQEILHRHPSNEEYFHYGELLVSGNLTETGLRDILLNP